MEKRTREIIALIIMGLMAVLIFAAMAWYIFVGHNWNVTATHIDDSIGAMDGYTVFLVEGTKDPKLKNLSDSEALAEAKAKAKADSPNVDGEDLPTLSQVAQSYEDKGAKVLTIDAKARKFLPEAQLVAKGERRIGFFQINAPVRAAAARMALKELRSMKPDFTVGFLGSNSLAQNYIAGLSLALVNDELAPWEPSFSSSGTFYASVPYRGEVEAIILAPSGVLSSKILEVA